MLVEEAATLVFDYLFRVLARIIGSEIVPQSVLDAIKLGIWDFEPNKHKAVEYDATPAMPGTCEKLNVLSERIRRGLPLWHPNDRRTYDDSERA